MNRITYKKVSQSQSKCKQSIMDIIGATEVQTYSPIMSKLFKLSPKNSNTIMYGSPTRLLEVLSADSQPSRYLCKVITDGGELAEEVPMFVKSSPMLDPWGYLNGDFRHRPICVLPKFGDTADQVPEDMLDTNNSAYVDDLFVYLSGQTRTRGFVHGLQYYGGCLAIKKDFACNVYDYIDTLQQSAWYREHLNKDFTVPSGSPFVATTLTLEEDDSDSLSVEEAEVDANEDVHAVAEEPVLMEEDANMLDEVITIDHKEDDHSSHYSSDTDVDIDSDTDSIASSINSNHSNHSSHSNSNHSNSNHSNRSNSSYAFLDSESTLMATIHQFPVQLICMEPCESTLDQLLADGSLTDDELLSALMQVIMTLLHYQRLYQFTHNDLHTANIMYVSTEEKYLYYSVDNAVYRVPTFNRIYKIIDFGRAIFSVGNKQFMSNNYAPTGEASGMFNMEPYMNPMKPEVLPSYSVDLCRLGCALHDFFEYDEDGKMSVVEALIADWCTDDYGQNILYKSNGDTRYPDFKLYKMIVRTAHTHTPQHQLQHPYFKGYRILDTPDNVPIMVIGQ